MAGWRHRSGPTQDPSQSAADIEIDCPVCASEQFDEKIALPRVHQAGMLRSALRIWPISKIIEAGSEEPFFGPAELLLGRDPRATGGREVDRRAKRRGLPDHSDDCESLLANIFQSCPQENTRLNAGRRRAGSISIRASAPKASLRQCESGSSHSARSRERLAGQRTNRRDAWQASARISAEGDSASLSSFGTAGSASTESWRKASAIVSKREIGTDAKIRSSVTLAFVPITFVPRMNDAHRDGPVLRLAVRDACPRGSCGSRAYRSNDFCGIVPVRGALSIRVCARGHCFDELQYLWQDRQARSR